MKLPARIVVHSITVLCAMYNLCFAHYHPKMGRFMQQDPLGITPNASMENPFNIHRQYEDGLNAYNYVKDAPVLYKDIYGLKCGCEEDCTCGANITNLLIDHFNDFISQKEGDLPFWPPSGARSLGIIARKNGGSIKAAMRQVKDCPIGDTCRGTVTICDKCFSQYHIDHFLIMNYIAISYGEFIARRAGREQENPPTKWSNADLEVNDVALCLASKMWPERRHSEYIGHEPNPFAYTPLNRLTRDEMCECVGAADMSVIGQKPAPGSSDPTDYQDCWKCDKEPPMPELELPPYDL